VVPLTLFGVVPTTRSDQPTGFARLARVCGLLLSNSFAVSSRMLREVQTNPLLFLGIVRLSVKLWIEVW